QSVHRRAWPQLRGDAPDLEHLSGKGEGAPACAQLERRGRQRERARGAHLCRRRRAEDADPALRADRNVAAHPTRSGFRATSSSPLRLRPGRVFSLNGDATSARLGPSRSKGEHLMAWISGKTLLNLGLQASQNPDFQKAFAGVLTGLGQALHANANDSEKVKQIADDLVKNAPAIVGAVVKDTPAAQHVDPQVVKQADQALQNK